MIKRAGHSPNQDPMFVTQLSGDRIFVPDYQTPEAEAPLAVNLIERAIYLQNTLDLFDATNQLNGLATAARIPTARIIRQFGHGEAANRIAANAGASAKPVFFAAQEEFARAFGRDKLIASGMNEQEAQAEVKRSFLDFWREYGLPSKRTERHKLWLKLDGDIRDYETQISMDNRENQRRPHKAEKQADDDKLTGMGTKERLTALLDDPRAGFLPVTTREKNRTLAFLDYLDNPDYPLGVRNQLMEVFFHQMAKSEVRDTSGPRGIDAVRSITFEIGGDLKDALTQLDSLRSLQAEVKQVDNPELSLAVAIGPEHAAYPALIRFMDIRTLQQTGTWKSIGRNPLRTSELRGKEYVDLPEKNKRLVGPYNTPKLSKYMASRIAKQPEILRIGPMRGAIDDAIANEEKRAAFARRILEDLAETRTFLTAQWAARLIFKDLAIAA